MNSQDRCDVRIIARALFFVTGIIFILSGVLYNEALVSFFIPKPLVSSINVGKIRSVQIYFLLMGLGFFIMSEIIRKISWIQRIVNRKIVINMLLTFLTLFLPLFILELSLKPIADLSEKTTIFIRDDKLGWRLRPNSEDIWCGVKVKINGKGLRGPELDYSKPYNAVRILYLGDSITFGHMLKSHEQAFPHLIEGILESRVGKQIETINAGVNGYSPWQEYIYLVTEGIKYGPDLAVISFVLNDVTQKFELIRYGGWNEGFELSESVHWLYKKSSILFFLRRVYARIRFGNDIRNGAIRKEILNVRALVNNPDRAEVRRAWKITLRNVSKIFDFCKGKNIPIILLIFPFKFQFDDVNAYSKPQAVIIQHAIDHGVPVIDLLPVLHEKMMEQGIKITDCFLDDVHLSALGNEIVSQIIADFIQKERLL